MDLKKDKESHFEMRNRSSLSMKIKSCSDCHRTKTPLWRGGPSGPKSLCNACGIKYHKKRRKKLGLAKGKKNNDDKMKKTKKHNGELSHSLKMRLMELGTKMLLHNRSEELMNKLREEEQAAILLMALSCGSVFVQDAIS